MFPSRAELLFQERTFALNYDSLINDHGLPHDPIAALVSPRPIGWISTLSASGVRNLAPYSYFNLMASRPPIVAFGSGGRKDTQINIEATKEFVCNLATLDLADAVNLSSMEVAHDVDEFDLVGLEAAPSRLVRPPRVARAPAALECRHVATIPLPSADPHEPHLFSLIVGQVVSVYIDDRFIKDGRVDTAAIRPLARHGYLDYSAAEALFEMASPD